jgi:hypothetical protein
MKLTDVDKKINEDLGDWVKNAVAKTGLLGRTEKLSAQQLETQERIYKTGLRYFKNQLQQSLDNAVKTGFVKTEPIQSPQSSSQTKQTDDINVSVTPGSRIIVPKIGALQYYKVDNRWFNAQNQPITNPDSIKSLETKADGGDAREERIPQSTAQQNVRPNKRSTRSKQRESTRFSLLSQLVEHRVLNEQQSVSGFIQDFVDGQTNEFGPNSEYENFINRVAKKAEQDYITTGKIEDKTYEQLWSAIFNWSKLGKKDRSRTTSYNSTDYVDSNNNRVDDRVEREQWKKQLVSNLDQLDVNQPESLEKLKSITRELLKFIQSSNR